MFSDDSIIHDDITVKLNLNCISEAVQLPEARKKVLEALLNELPTDTEDHLLSYCQDVLELLEGETDPKTEYSGILIWWLRDYLAQTT